ncbi:uncharacterized protein TNCV_2553811 [Trichonephila clavipes]|nr:uncharacterized protein TNCV_2553811 [Trichonephila clavipes]
MRRTLTGQRYVDDIVRPHFTCRNCGGGDRGRVAIYRPFGEVSLSLNRTVTCMVLKANDRRASCPCHDECRGPRSDYVRQVTLATTTQQQIRSPTRYPLQYRDTKRDFLSFVYDAGLLLLFITNHPLIK